MSQRGDGGLEESLRGEPEAYWRGLEQAWETTRQLWPFTAGGGDSALYRVVAAGWQGQAGGESQGLLIVGGCDGQ